MIGWRKSQLAAAVTVTAASMVLGFGTTANGAPIPDSPNAPAASADGTPVPVIVILKDQIADAPADHGHLGARQQKAANAQAPLLAKVKANGGTNIKSFVVGNAFSATVSPALRAQLQADPSVASVVADTQVTVAPPAATKAKAKAAETAEAPKAAAAPQAVSGSNGQGPEEIATNTVCPSDPSKPLLEPEGLYSTRAVGANGRPGAADLATGKGVKVAYIADGLDPNNPDFIRADGSHAVVDYQDFAGDGINAPTGGAEAFGDASAVIAQGRQVYDVSKFVNASHPLPAGCNIRVRGLAPDADLVALKAGGEVMSNSSILQAIDYAVRVSHVDVLNESFGGNVTPDSGAHDTIALFNDQAVKAGVTVAVSSGDAGLSGTIGTPATDPNVIAVGASTDNQNYQQTGYAAAQFSNKTWSNSRISALSSGGFTQAGRTVDLVAPGESDWALCSPDLTKYTDCKGFGGTGQPIQSFGGTSQAAPFVTGAAALVIQAFRDTHGGDSPSPALVKKLLTGTAQDLGVPAEEQGAGLLNVRAAVEAARGIQDGDGTPGSNAVVVNTGQVDIAGAPGSTHTTDVSVTNTSDTKQTVTAATRSFVPQSSNQQTVQLDTASTDTFKYATNGATWVQKQVKFTVPAGADRLAASIAWQGAATPVVNGPVVRMTLLDPSGKFETNTRPQGGATPANYGLVDVPHPVAGEWTAILYTPAGKAGYNGAVQLGTSTQRAVPAGSVGPNVVDLQPGQTKTLKAQVTVPATSGDSSEAITVSSSDGTTTSVPVVLRSLVPLNQNGGTFTGTITGGNGRGSSPTQSFSYAFDVPKGQKDLRVGVTVKDSKLLMQGALISPNGTPIDVEGNGILDAQGNLTSTTAGVSASTVNPAAGRWRFVLNVVGSVSGQELSQDFAGTIAFNQNRATAAGLPNDARTKLAAGKPVTVQVNYTNNTVATQKISADGRLDRRTDVPLVPQGASASVTLPLSLTSSVPAFLVPPGTDQVKAVAASSTPAQLELSATTGSPDLFGDLKKAQDGSTISVAGYGGSAAQPIVPGMWSTFVQQIGPFGTAGAPAGTATITATAHTQAFDPALTSSTGDPYAAAVNASAAAANPVTVAPGATGSLQVTLTPTGPKGSTVHGVLYLVSAPTAVATANNFLGTTGGVLAAIPYSYTVN
ncbi:S8 family serine peptidase [Streptomyces kaniharaensis]|uniref:S8 family serine peptidase n=1 Tax=Streptomyces kaniharaensis TaxID=212423 RepID=A0A6N7KMV1_9ACTN|nr:S8 family serine peptidase [Streptomyces kaniharaensis]MQS10953.1 S8 family serine peptidase [Streptomyces kaniharaensis]